MTLQEYIEKREKEFDEKFGSIHSDRPMPSGLETANNIKAFHRQSLLDYADLVKKEVEGKRRMVHGGESSETWKFGKEEYNQAVEDISHLPLLNQDEK